MVASTASLLPAAPHTADSLTHDQLVQVRDEAIALGIPGLAKLVHAAAGWVVGGRVSQTAREMVAKYLNVRAAADARGLRLQWVVTGPLLEQWITCHTATRAEREVARLDELHGLPAHAIVLGLGDRYGWSRLAVES